jgi:hypothetical protein
VATVVVVNVFAAAAMFLRAGCVSGGEKVGAGWQASEAGANLAVRQERCE